MKKFSHGTPLPKIPNEFQSTSYHKEIDDRLYYDPSYPLIRLKLVEHAKENAESILFLDLNGSQEVEAVVKTESDSDATLIWNRETETWRTS
jgi:hypothetical protein